MPEATSAASQGPASAVLEAGRAAFAQRDWQTAFDRLTTADERMALSGADLEALATAAFFTARGDLQIEVMERAFQVYLAEGAQERAAHVALEIAREYFYTARPSIASGWVRRAERMLEPAPEPPSAARGLLALVRSEIALATGDLDLALTLAEQATSISERATDVDLRAHTLTHIGVLKIARGATAEGFALLEEASVSAVNGELSPMTAGITCCRMIAVCRDLNDYRRATEWIDQTERYCRRQAVSGFPGVCRIHKAELTALRGAWEQAESELERATAELRPFNAMPPMADGYYALAEIRRLRGDYPGAEVALREADALGRAPQPARALIRLAKGDAAGALAQITRAVLDETRDLWARARLLQAQVEIAVAAGEPAQARTALDQLDHIVATVSPAPAPALVASRQVAHGRVLLAETEPERAAQELRRAISGWRGGGVPYEVARAQTLLASALRALGDEDDADAQLEAALDAFDRLGARPDAGAAALALRIAAERREARTTVRRTFMFTDIEGSTRLAEELGDAAWAERLRWHDETLGSQITVAGGEIVKSTGDGFFAAFLDAEAAVAAAVAIQRAMHPDHRAASPPDGPDDRKDRDRPTDQRAGDLDDGLRVRIGLHTADANHVGSDYTGLGVHVAARVGALARGAEILATADVVTEAAPARARDVREVGEFREVAVRGVSTPVRVAAVDWS